LALVSLALASLPNRVDVEAKLQQSFPFFKPMAPTDAVAALTAELNSPNRSMPRLVVLDAMVRFMARSPAAPPQPAPGGRRAGPPQPVALPGAIEAGTLGALLTALGNAGPRPGDGLPPGGPAPPSPASLLQDGLNAVVGMPNLAQAWTTFSATAKPALCEFESNKPGCDCNQITVVNGRQQRTVVSRFRTAVAVNQLKAYADPRNWPRCSNYFKAMEQATFTRLANGWTGVFDETVEIIPGAPLVTPLQFNYRETTDGAGNLVGVRLDYDLANPAGTPHIAVDRGWISISTDPAQPLPTGVEAVKVISFIDPAYQAWTSMVCDTAWGELCIDTAMQCSDCPGVTGGPA
jgi:hypothetical protein